MRSLVRVFIRIILVFTFLNLLAGSAPYVGTFLQQEFRAGLISLIGAVVIVTGILLMLWAKVDWLSKLLVNTTDDNPITINTASADLFQTAMRVIGLVLVVGFLPDLFGRIAYDVNIGAFISSEYGRSIPTSAVTSQANQIREYVVIGTKLLVGLYLLLGVKGIYRTLNYAWETLRMNKPEEN
jgi:hypothetical protein